MTELTKYEVTFVVRNGEDKIDHKWTATYRAKNFGDAEAKALVTLAVNGDQSSKIERIELW